MQKNDFVMLDNSIYRIIDIDDTNAVLIACDSPKMPFTMPLIALKNATVINDYFLPSIRSYDSLSINEKAMVAKRFTMISNAVSVPFDSKLRKKYLSESSVVFGISKQTLKHYLWKYLVYQDIAALAPYVKHNRELSTDEKNMRWALNKYYYTYHNNSLSTAYIGVIVIDEIQNLINSKHGQSVVNALTQLINSASVSVCFIGTSEVSDFFSRQMILARRSIGLSCKPFEYSNDFKNFCLTILKYCYVANKPVIDESVLLWLYN